MKNKIATVPEILGTLLSAHVADSADGLKANAKEYLADNYGVDVSAFDIAVVENTEAQVHISLPYYSGIEEASIKATTDAEMSDVDGGVIDLAIGIAIVVILAIGLPSMAGVLGARATGALNKDYSIPEK